MDIDIIEFKNYCNSRNWIFDQYTSEFTFQFRLCRFIENFYKDYKLELESNIERYGLSKLTKKEIDIDLVDNKNSKTAIEIKYIRDFGSHNIGMYSYCEDIKFLEEIVENIFDNGLAIIFTSIENLYTEPTKELNPKNTENLALYEAFRINRKLCGELKIKTGKMDKTLKLLGQYNLNWIDFNETIKACIVKVVKKN